MGPAWRALNKFKFQLTQKYVRFENIPEKLQHIVSTKGVYFKKEISTELLLDLQVVFLRQKDEERNFYEFTFIFEGVSYSLECAMRTQSISFIENIFKLMGRAKYDLE
jgi:hypothetical protein